MKKVTIIFAMVMITIGAAAQKVSFGAKSGINISSVRGDDTEDASSKIGLMLGGLVNFKVSNAFSVQPELLYNGLGVKEKGTDLKINLNYINIPLLAKFSTKQNIFFETGPQLGFLLSAKAKESGVSIDVKDEFKSTDFSWAVGVGVLTKINLGLNFRYVHGLSKLNKEGTNNYNKNFQIGLFYMFGK